MGAREGILHVQLMRVPLGARTIVSPACGGVGKVGPAALSGGAVSHLLAPAKSDPLPLRLASSWDSR